MAISRRCNKKGKKINVNSVKCMKAAWNLEPNKIYVSHLLQMYVSIHKAGYMNCLIYDFLPTNLTTLLSQSVCFSLSPREKLNMPEDCVKFEI